MEGMCATMHKVRAAVAINTLKIRVEYGLNSSNLKASNLKCEKIRIQSEKINFYKIIRNR